MCHYFLIVLLLLLSLLLLLLYFDPKEFILANRCSQLINHFMLLHSC